MSSAILSPSLGVAIPHSRLRIQAMDVDLTSRPDYPVCLKLLVNSQVHSRLPEVPVGRPLHWDQISPIDVDPTDYIEVRAYEVHFWRKLRIGTVRFRVDRIDHSSSELKVQDNIGLVPSSVRFTFARLESDSSVSRAVQRSAVAAINRDSSVLQNMGKAHSLVDAMIKVTGQVSELNPITNVTLDICKRAWEILQQRECDGLVKELVIGMGDILPLADAVKDEAKVLELKTTIVEMLHLIEDASRFIIEYKSDGAAVRAVRAFISSTAQEQVAEFMRQFKKLKEDFDRGMMTQVVLRVEQVALSVETLLNDADREVLAKLITSDAGYDPSTGCLEGTRTTIRKDIQAWVDSGDRSQPLFWLYGLAGCGKSTVARSVCKQLDDTSRLAGIFFCKRDIEHLSKPENVVSTLAANLAFVFSPYGARLVAALREKPQLASSALAVRFRGMIVEPLEAINNQVEQRTLVVIIDALDECGTPDTRIQLLGSLLELSRLAPWLKVILTSRPNEEIAGFFRRKGKALLHRDLFKEDPESVHGDICLYIRDRLTQLMDDDEALGENSWLDDGTVKQLASRANGLFIWARTACNVICNSVNPDEKIKNRLNGKPSQDSNEQLGSLYTTVLNEALGGLIDDVHKIRRCIAVVIVTRIPLIDTALVDLLGGWVNLTELRLVVRRLASVLYRDQNGAVRVVHQSFSDYMIDRRCPVEYRMDANSENFALATSCVHIMTKELRFNICALQDSRKFNHEILDLAPRIQAAIRPHLAYSCVYWANHLLVTPAFKLTSEEHQALAGYIMGILSGPQALYWLEALSLLERLYASETSLLELMDWMQEPGHNISIYASELQRFIAAFYVPISQSTPHLYVSAVAFGSEQFDTIRALKDRFPNLVQVTRGEHLGKVSNQWLRVIQHTSPVWAVAYSLDGKLLATGSNVVNVWEARTGVAMLNPLRGHRGSVTSVAFSPGGDVVVSGSDDMTVRVWDLRTNTAALSPLEGHTEPVTSVAVSPDGQYIVSGSEDTTVRVWDLHTGTAILSPLRGHSDFVTSVAVSPDSQHIVSGAFDDTVRVWHLSTGAATLGPLRGHSKAVRSVAISPDGRRIVSGSDDGTVRVWDLRTGAAALNPILGHHHPVASVAFACHGERIVSGSWDKTVRVWDLGTGAVAVNLLQGHSDDVKSVAFSPDGQYVISGSEDKTVRVWDLHTGNTACNPLQGHTSRVWSVASSPDGRHIASGSRDRTVRVWDLRTGISSLEPLEGHSGIVSSVAFSSDGQWIASGSHDTTLRVWDLSDGASACTTLHGHSKSVMAVAFSPDNRYIVSGSTDNSVRVWDLRTSTSALSPLEGHTDWVVSVVFSFDGHHIVSGSRDTTVRVWHFLTGASAFKPLQGHTDSVTSVACSPDGKYIVSGSEDHTVRLWSMLTGIAVFDPLQGHSSFVESVAFSPDSKRIVSSSRDNTIRVWDLHTGTAALNPLRGHSKPVSSVTFSPDGQHLISGSWDSTVRLWDISSASASFSDLPHNFPSPPLPVLPVMGHHLAHSFTLTHDGWVLDKSQRPLLWLPTQFQRRQVDHSLYAISMNPLDHPVSFDFTKFKCGTEWTSVHDLTAI